MYEARLAAIEMAMRAGEYDVSDHAQTQLRDRGIIPIPLTCATYPVRLSQGARRAPLQHRPRRGARRGPSHKRPKKAGSV